MELCKLHTTNRGFSLIELMVTLTIATLIIGGVLLRFRVFDSVVGLRGEAYDFALTVRSAQVYAVSAVVSTDRSSYEQAVGVHYDANNPNTYIFFVDSNDNNRYNRNVAVIETYTIPDTYQITYICIDSDCTDNDVVTLMFKRPEFDTNFLLSNSAVSASSVVFGFALADDTNQVFEVEVGVTGQISVTAP